MEHTKTKTKTSKEIQNAVNLQFEAACRRDANVEGKLALFQILELQKGVRVAFMPSELTDKRKKSILATFKESRTFEEAMTQETRRFTFSMAMGARLKDLVLVVLPRTKEAMYKALYGNDTKDDEDDKQVFCAFSKEAAFEFVSTGDISKKNVAVVDVENNAPKGGDITGSTRKIVCSMNVNVVRYKYAAESRKGGEPFNPEDMKGLFKSFIVQAKQLLHEERKKD